jgi:hypothetical protein
VYEYTGVTVLCVCKLLKISALFALGLLSFCSRREQWEKSTWFATHGADTPVRRDGAEQ